MSGHTIMVWRFHIGHLSVRPSICRPSSRISLSDDNYCPFDIIWKDVFAWRFNLNENILFWLTISYQKPFVFSASVFCSQIFILKLNVWPKIGLTYVISIVKMIFGFFFSFLPNLNYYVSQQYCENFRKNWTSETCWKSDSKLPTLQISA